MTSPAVTFHRARSVEHKEQRVRDLVEAALVAAASDRLDREQAGRA